VRAAEGRLTTQREPRVPETSDNPQREPHRRASAVTLKGAAGGDIATPARVVAKGQGALAEQILSLAFATGVKVREDADLVEILEAIEVESEVPLHALATVAEILTYVYRANRGAAGAALSETATER
jgi:flagellar biosynthesis protein